MKPSISILALLGALLLSHPAMAGGSPAGAELVADLAPGSEERGSIARYFVPFGDRALFLASDPQHGRELWLSDGTGEGTRRVIDACPGPCNGAVPVRPEVVGERFFFYGRETPGRWSLWVGDGTEVRRLFVSGPNSNPPSRPAALGDRLVFKAYREDLGWEPWVTDGTPEGTRLLADLCPGACSSAAPSSDTAVLDGLLYFGARSPVFGGELHVTDGTPGGTALAADVCPGECNGYPADLFVWRGRLLFTARRSGEGRELWSYVSGAGARLEAEPVPGEESSFDRLHGDFVWRERLYFKAFTGTSDEWFRLDEPGAGARPAVAPPAGLGAFDDFRVVGKFFHWQDRLYFSAFTGATTEWFWIDDPEARAQPAAGLPVGPGELEGLTILDGTLLLIARTTEPGRGATTLWGVEAPGAAPQALVPAMSSLSSSGVLEGSAFFVGEKPRRPGSGDEPPDEVLLWRTEGTAAGTEELGPFEELRKAGIAGDRLFLVADRGDEGAELWSVGASGGPAPVANLAHDLASSAPFALTSSGNDLVFLARGSFRDGGTIWRAREGAVETLSERDGFTDLVALEDVVVAVHPSDLSRVTPSGEVGLLYDGPTTEVVAADSRLFFGSYGSDQELWTSDGTPEGTRFLADPNPGGWRDCTPGTQPVAGICKAYPRELTALGDGIAFVARTESEELWVSDGTAEGTFALGAGELVAGDGELLIERLTGVGETLFFVADHDPGAGLRRALWRWRPGLQAPDHVLDLNVHAGLPTPDALRLTAVGGRLLFGQPAAGDEGAELWTVRPTGPPRLVHHFASTASARLIREIHAFGDRALLSILDRETGDELWITDGNTRTVPLGDLASGDSSSRPTGFRTVGECSLFAAAGDDRGHELWLTDGTGGGTRRIVDLAAGVAASSPVEITPTGKMVYFNADAGRHGRELFAVDREAVDALCQGPPPGPWIESRAMPGFRVKVRFGREEGDPVEGAASSRCIPEALCVRGALPRTELLVRVVGPRPNGSLWPLVVKLSTAEATVWIEQVSTEAIRRYTLAGARPGFDVLTGVHDRQGFQPAGEETARKAPVATGELDGPPPPRDEWLTSPEVPGFRFQMAIRPPGGESVRTRTEPECLEESLCTSGALPGRTEVVARVVGPKPNGRLWPTLMRLTPSGVEVWVEQTATGAIRHYRLKPLRPGDESLDGLFDRNGFEPVE